MARSDVVITPTHSGSGLSAFLGGIWFVLTSPSVWPLACVPVLMALVLACGLTSVGIYYSGRVAERLLGADANAAASWAATVLGWALTLFFAALVALVLAQPLSGWALEAIVRKQERRLTGSCPPDLGFLHSLWIGVRCSIFIVVAGGTMSVLLLTVTLLFPPAVVVTIPLKFVTASWFLAWDLIDYPLGLRGQGIRARLRWASAHFGAFTTFGLAWAAVLLIPGVFLFVLPLGVAGAARLVAASER